MVRALAVLAAGPDDERPIRDVLLLNHDERRSPRGTHTGLRGTMIDIALPSGIRMYHDDRLILDDGALVEIVARPEPLFEIRAADVSSAARLAWLLGDHHIQVDIQERRLRLLRTETAERLLRSLGVTMCALEAPFEPEGGAYEHAGGAVP